MSSDVWGLGGRGGMEIHIKIVYVFLINMNIEKGLESSSVKIHMILKHKPGSNISFSAYLNVLYISHYELQQSML